MAQIAMISIGYLWSVLLSEQGCGHAARVRANLAECPVLPPEVMATAASQGYVWVCVPIAAGICFDVQGPSYHQKPYHCLWSRLLHEAMLMSEGHDISEDHVDLCGLCSHLRPC